MSRNKWGCYARSSKIESDDLYSVHASGGAGREKIGDKQGMEDSRIPVKERDTSSNEFEESGWCGGGERTSNEGRE